MSNIITVEFNGRPVHFTDEAFSNLTEMCAVYGKRPLHFLQLESTKRYIAALEEDLMTGIPSSNGHRVTGIPSPESRNYQVVFTRKGELAGTWTHPDLAFECARWLDPKFAVWCNRTIRKILSGELILVAAKIPAHTEPLILADRLARAKELLPILQELHTAFERRHLVATAHEIATRFPSERKLGYKTLIRFYLRWKHSGFNEISLVPYASIYKRGGKERLIA